MSRKHKFIVLTGLDGSGKDFVAKHLHEADPESVLLATPTPPFMACRAEIDRLALDWPAAHYLFYLASVVHASGQIEEAIMSCNVYCVRYLLDTVVYHRALGLLVDLVYETPVYRILRPDFNIFLEVADERVRRSRLRSRGKFTIGNQILEAGRLANRILEQYRHYSDEFISVDNTHRSIEEVVLEIQGRTCH